MSAKSHMNYRNRKLLDLAREMPCMNCGVDDGTIVAAHGNGAIYGKGMGIKSHDCYFAGLCFRCHYDYDQGSKMTRQEKQELFTQAMLKTWIWLWRNEKIVVAR